jgi:hypothetical protein
MASEYIAPGVTVSEDISGSIAPLIATPDDICIIGLAPVTQAFTTKGTFSTLDLIDLNVQSDATDFVIDGLFARNPLTAGTGYSKSDGYASTTYTVIDDTTGTIASKKSKYLQRKTAVAGTLASSITATQTSGNILISVNSGITLPTTGSIQLGSILTSNLEIIHYTALETAAANEIQTLTETGTPTGGTFTITANKSDWQTEITSPTLTTIALPWNAPATSTSVTGLTVTTTSGSTSATLGGTGTTTLAANTSYNISASTIPSSNNITFTTGGTTTVPTTITGTATSTNSTTLNDSTKSWTANAYIGGTIVAGSSSGVITANGTTSITVSSWTGGTPSGTSAYTIYPVLSVTLSSGTNVTAGTAANATVQTVSVKAELEKLSYIGTGNVTVAKTGTSAYTYAITFSGALANQNMKTLVIASSLTGTNSPVITVATSAQGSTIKLTKYTRGQGGTQSYAHAIDDSVKYVDPTNIIPDNTSVNVSWSCVPADHWDPKPYTSHSKIVQVFGNPYSDDEKSVNSPISLAAMIAINNGAQRIWVQPLFKGEIGAEEQPDSVVDADWATTLVKLQSIDNLGVIVPAVGQSNSVTDSQMTAIFANCQNFTAAQRETTGNYVIVIAGEDGTHSASLGQPDTLQTHADGLDGDQQFVLVSPSKFTTITPKKNVTLDIGGQYAAAAVAGRLVSLSASKSLTRKAITGFTALPKPIRSRDEKNADAQSGLLVIEDNGSVIQIRHAITTAAGGTAPAASQSELSVVRAKQKMVASLLTTVDTQIIGQIVADSSAELVVESTIRGVLQQLVDDKEIVGFNNVIAQTKSYNPTIINIAFNYRPAFPVNYVEINFAVDITNGSLINTTTGA